jgi:SAM-dependent methyltransferase
LVSLPNYFDAAAVAARYARARPYLHPPVIARITPFVGQVDRAIDVACGTGMSCLALLDLADDIVGLDVSLEMLAEAPRVPRIAYVAGEAEALPFANEAASLVSVGLAYHWFDGTRFLQEAARVLRAGGWMAVYNTWFTGRMAQDPAFTDWWSGRYLVRYPPPARRRHAITDDDVAGMGFDLIEHATLERPVEFSTTDLIEYLLTQSNVIGAATEGSLSGERDWLRASLHDRLHERGGTFHFSGELWLLRRR